MLQALKQAKIHAREYALLRIDLNNCVTLIANNVMLSFQVSN